MVGASRLFNNPSPREVETFDESKATEALGHRVTTAERLRDAVMEALKKTHGMLTEEQRKKLAYMLRSGNLTI